MSLLLQEYSDDLNDTLRVLDQTLGEIQSLIKGDNTTTTTAPQSLESRKEQAQNKIRSCEQLLSQAKELTSNIEAEAAEAAIPAQRPLWRQRAADARSRLSTMDKALTEARHEATMMTLSSGNGLSQANRERAELLGGGGSGGASGTSAAARRGGRASQSSSNNPFGPDYDNASSDDQEMRQRAEMSENTSRMKGGTATLTAAERTLASTEGLAESTKAELYRQRDTLHNIGDATHETDVEITHSRRITSEMTRTMMKHKLLFFGIILLLVIIIIVIAVSHFGGGSGSGGRSHTQTGVMTSAPSPQAAADTSSSKQQQPQQDDSYQQEQPQPSSSQKEQPPQQYQQPAGVY